MSSFKIKVKIDNTIQEKLKEFNNPTTMLAIHNTFAKRCDPYVPFASGTLAQTVVVTPNYIRYIQPYARRQYFGDNFNFSIDKHPLATSRWDKAMLRDHGDEFNKEVEDLLYWRMKKHASLG